MKKLGAFLILLPFFLFGIGYLFPTIGFIIFIYITGPFPLFHLIVWICPLIGAFILLRNEYQEKKRFRFSKGFILTVIAILILFTWKYVA